MKALDEVCVCVGVRVMKEVFKDEMWLDATKIALLTLIHHHFED